MNSALLLVGGRRAALGTALLASFAAQAGLTLMTPLFMRLAFDGAIAAGDGRRFGVLLAAFTAAAFVCRRLAFWGAARTERVKDGLAADLTLRLARKHFRLPDPTASGSDPGAASSRLVDEPAEGTAAAVALLAGASAAFASLAVSGAMLLSVSPRGALLAAAFAVPLRWLGARAAGDIRRFSDAEKDEAGRLRGYAGRAADAYRTVRLFALERAVEEGLARRLEARACAREARFAASSRQGESAANLGSLLELAVIAVCGSEMMSGRMTFGGFMAFMSAFWSAVGAVRALASKGTELAQVQAAAARLAAVLDAPEALARDGGAALALSGAAFDHAAGGSLPGVDLALGAGERAVLRGPNGAGKSTLLAVAAGFLTPTRGCAQGPALARVSACLTPHRFLPGTVAENLGASSPAERETLASDPLLRALALAELLERDTERLSIGQRQKLAVAAALRKEADLYLFDEPLANVDPEAKRAVIEAILARTRGKAVLAVLHGDTEFDRRFDRVVELGRPEAAPTRCSQSD